MKPTPLPPNPKLSHRVEYVLQWLVGWLIIDIPGHPMISGLCTGTILGLVLFGLFYIPGFILGWHLLAR